jgi:hypothetical protein
LLEAWNLIQAGTAVWSKPVQQSDLSRYGNLVQAGTVNVGNPDAFAVSRGVDEFQEITHAPRANVT